MTTMTIGNDAQLSPEGLEALLRVLVTRAHQRISSSLVDVRTAWIDLFGREARRFRDATASLQKL